MPIKNYEGNTFVAYLDICGFKALMRSEQKAWTALDKLYTYGYQALKQFKNQAKIEGVFVSDCGILFVRKPCIDNTLTSPETALHPLLSVIRAINRNMLNNDFMLTTSIAYGPFKYQKRIEFVGIEKNPIYGNAYVSAYFDCENGLPKIQPGQCRLIKGSFPEGYDMESLNNGQFSGLLREKPGDAKHYYFYWMRNYPEEIDTFEEIYQDAYNLKYQGMLKALKGC